MAKNNEKFVSRENAKTLWGYMVDLLTGKQNKLTFDDTPTQGSDNPVKSGGIFTALAGKGTYSKPQNGIPKTDLENAVQTSLGLADSALQSETDPTVPSWAKQTNKPSYNADEISSTGTTNQFVTSTEKSTWNSKGTYSKPSGGIPKSDLASAVQTSLGKADTALQSYTETDPTVPNWAKQTNKPSYNADEISSSGTTNQFVTSSEKNTWNGKGTYSKPSGGIPKSDLASAVQTSLGKADTALQSYTETDPTVPSWAKQTSKPSYNSDEISDDNRTHKFATATQLTQIETNKTNIMYGLNTGVKNILPYRTKSNAASDTGITVSLDADNIYKITGTKTISDSYVELDDMDSSELVGDHVASVSASGTGDIQIAAYGYNGSTWTLMLTTSTSQGFSVGSYTKIKFRIRFTGSINSSYNATVKAMVCPMGAWGQSHDWQPPALPNSELTAELFKNSYTAPSKHSYITSVRSGGYFRIGNIVIVNIVCTVGTALPLYQVLFTDLPTPVASSSLNAGDGVAVLSTNTGHILSLTKAGQIINYESAIETGGLEISGVYVCL